ncbi:MAG: TVP38/TMEM64 family protein [bacterium]
MNKPGSLQSFLQKKWPLIVSILLFMAAVISYFVLPPVEQFINEAYNTLTSQDEERISDWVNELGIWGPSFIITTMVLQMFLLIVPSPLLMLVSILAYGPYWGSVLAIAAIFIASTVGYYVGKFLSYWTIQKLIGEKKKKKLAFYVNRYGFWAVVITRLSPFLSNDAISFVGGIVKMKYWKFIGATLLGIVPLTILFAWFGENNERLKTGLIWTVIVSILIFTVYVVYDRRKIKDHH